MQDGSVIRRNRKKHSDIWQFRWWEKTADGKKIYRRRQHATIDQIPDIETTRKVASLLVPDLNPRMAKSKPVSLEQLNEMDSSRTQVRNQWPGSQLPWQSRLTPPSVRAGSALEEGRILA